MASGARSKVVSNVRRVCVIGLKSESFMKSGLLGIPFRDAGLVGQYLEMIYAKPARDDFKIFHGYRVIQDPHRGRLDRTPGQLT